MPDEANLWQWVAGGLAGTVAAGTAAIGKMFSGSLGEVRQEVKALEARVDVRFDDIWEVINAEREAQSKATQRIYERLSGIPTRDEMQAGIRDVKADIGALGDLIRRGQ